MAAVALGSSFSGLAGQLFLGFLVENMYLPVHNDYVTTCNFDQSPIRSRTGTGSGRIIRIWIRLGKKFRIRLGICPLTPAVFLFKGTVSRLGF